MNPTPHLLIIVIVLALYSPATLLHAQEAIDPEKPATTNLLHAQEATGLEKPAAKTETNYTQLLEKFLNDQQETYVLQSVRCKYVSAETLRRLIENFLSPAGTVACSGEDDVLIVYDTPARIEQVKQIVKEADQPVPQILVEARIVEFELSDALNREVEIGFNKMGDSDPLRRVFNNLMLPGSDALGSSVKDVEASARGGSNGRIWAFGGNDSFKIWALVNYLQTKDCARLLSSPNIVIRRGADGNITTGEKVPIDTETTTGSSISKSTRFENVGVKLIVRPVMVADDRIRLRINPEFSNIARYDLVSKAPYIALRSATTELEAKSGDMIILGGLLRKEERETDTHVPYLWRIPLLGWLFTGKTTRSITTQLVIFMTPHLITPETAAARDQAQTGKISEPLRLKMQEIEKQIYDENQSLGSPVNRISPKKGAQ